MKNTFLIPLICLLLVSCSTNDSNNNCGYLLSSGVNFTFNVNLPQYSNLQFPSNSVYVANQGNGGVIVTNTGTGYVAWDAADPNHTYSDCSIMTINGLNAKCNCDDENEYSLITGQSLNDPLPCTLKMYRVEQTGSSSYLVSN